MKAIIIGIGIFAAIIMLLTGIGIFIKGLKEFRKQENEIYKQKCKEVYGEDFWDENLGI